jgi:hypothetical protein
MTHLRSDAPQADIVEVAYGGESGLAVDGLTTEGEAIQGVSLGRGNDLCDFF